MPDHFFVFGAGRAGGCSSSFARRSMIHSAPTRSMSSPNFSQKNFNRARSSRRMIAVNRTSSSGLAVPSVFLAMTGESNSCDGITASIAGDSCIDKTDSVDTIDTTDAIKRIGFYARSAMTMKGYKQTPEHIAARCKYGPDHHWWKGDRIAVRSGRTRALRMYPEIGPRVKCGGRAERHHRDGDTSNNEPSNIVPLCRKCHMLTDGRLHGFTALAKKNVPLMMKRAAEVKRAATACKRGHPLSGENLYVSDGRRVCKECRRIHKQEYRKRIRGKNEAVL